MGEVRLGFIGAGNMGGAIIRGVTQAGILSTGEIMVCDSDRARAGVFADAGHPVSDNVEETVSRCPTVVLAVKPQVMDEVLARVRAAMKPETVLVSIAAGISAEYIRRRIGFECKLVMVMPNTPLLLGCGAVALCRIEPVTAEEFGFVKSLFEAAGIAEEIPPNKMNEIIAVSASSPAFIYRFAEQTARWAERSGIDYGVAMRLFCQTLTGSARMLAESGKSARELIDMVCSPGGATLAAMDAMTGADFDGALVKAFEACTRRAEELGRDEDA